MVSSTALTRQDKQSIVSYLEAQRQNAISRSLQTEVRQAEARPRVAQPARDNVNGLSTTSKTREPVTLKTHL